MVSLATKDATYGEVARLFVVGTGSKEAGIVVKVVRIGAISLGTRPVVSVGALTEVAGAIVVARTSKV